MRKDTYIWSGTDFWSYFVFTLRNHLLFIYFRIKISFIVGFFPRWKKIPLRLNEASVTRKKGLL